MLAPPYVAMKCSVTSDRGHPTPSPLTIGFVIVEMFLMSDRSEVNWGQVVGFVRPWAAKNDGLYQKPGFTFPVYTAP